MLSKLNLPLVIFLIVVSALFTWAAGYRYAPGERPLATPISENTAGDESADQADVQAAEQSSEARLQAMLSDIDNTVELSHHDLLDRIAVADRLLKVPPALDRLPPGPRQRAWQQRVSRIGERIVQFD